MSNRTRSPARLKLSASASIDPAPAACDVKGLGLVGFIFTVAAIIGAVVYAVQNKDIFKDPLPIVLAVLVGLVLLVLLGITLRFAFCSGPACPAPSGPRPYPREEQTDDEDCGSKPNVNKRKANKSKNNYDDDDED